MKRKVLMSALCVMLVLAMALCVFAACNDDSIYYDTYKISFMDGDMLVDIAHVEVGKTLSASDIPTAPEHDAEIFDGWFYNGERVLGGFKPTSDVIVTAQYHTQKAGEYVVSFSLGDYAGSATAPNKLAIAAGGKVTLPLLDIQWDNHDFSGWKLADSADETVYAPGSAYTVNGNITFVAQWKVEFGSMRFVTNGAAPIEEKRALTGSKIDVPADPVKANRTFAGWYLSEDFSGDPVQIPSTMPGADVTYYAKFVVRYTVKWLTQNLAMDGYDEEVLERELSDSEGNVSRSEYKAITGFTMVEGAGTFMPQNGATYEYKYDRRAYTVTYKLGYGEDVEVDDVQETVYYGHTYAVKTYDELCDGIGRNYRFHLWAQDESGEDVATDTYVVDRNLTFYAQYYVAYTDMSGGDDLIFVYDDGSVILDRAVIGDKTADVVQTASDGATLFTFTEPQLTGKLSELTHGFAYESVGLSAQLLDIFGDEICSGTTLVTDEFYTATLTVDAQAAENDLVAFPYVSLGLSYASLGAGEYTGTFMRDAVLGDYVLIISDVTVGSGEPTQVRVNFDLFTISDQEGRYFAVRGIEAGSYYEYYDPETDETDGDYIILDGYGGIYREDSYYYLEWEGNYVKLTDYLIYAYMEDTTFGILENEALLSPGSVIGATQDYSWFFYTFEYGDINLFGEFVNAAEDDDSTLLVDGLGGAIYTDNEGNVIEGTLTYDVEELITFVHFDAAGHARLTFRLDYAEGTFEVCDDLTIEMIYELYTLEEDMLGYLFEYSDGSMDMYVVQLDMLTYEESLVYACSGVPEDMGEGMYSFFYSAYASGVDEGENALGMIFSIDDEMVDEEAGEGVAFFIGYVLKGTFNMTDSSDQLELFADFSATYHDGEGQTHEGSYTVEIANDADETIVVLFECEDEDLSLAFFVDLEHGTIEQRLYIEYQVANQLYMEVMWIIDIYDDGTIQLFDLAEDDYGDYGRGELVGEGTYKPSETDEDVYEVYEDGELSFRFKYNDTLLSTTCLVVEIEDLVEYAGTYTCDEDDTQLVLDSFAGAVYTDEYGDEHIGAYFFNDTEDGFVFMCYGAETIDGWCEVEFEFVPDPETQTFTTDLGGGGVDPSHGFAYEMFGDEWRLVNVDDEVEGEDLVYIYLAEFDDYEEEYSYYLAAEGTIAMDENYVYTFTVTEIIDDMLLPSDFTGFKYIFSGANQIKIYDEASHVTYSVTGGGELALDGFGGGSYTDASGNVFDGEYEIEDDSVMFFWLNEDYEYVTYYFTINDDGTVTLDEHEPEPEPGREAGEYQIVNMYAGWGTWFMELDGLGNVYIYTDAYSDDPDAVGTYTYDPLTSHGAVHITEALTEAGEDVKDFKFVLVSIGYSVGYVEANEQLIDSKFFGDGWSVLMPDGYFRATYIDKYGYTYTGNYAEWDGFIYFYPGGNVELVFSINVEDGTFEAVNGVYYLSNINGNTKLVILGDGVHAYLQIEEEIYTGTVEAQLNSQGDLEGEFISDDGAHDFDFRASAETGLFSKVYDINGMFTLVNDSWYVLGDYIFMFYSGYNGGSFMVYDEYYSMTGAGTYALKDKANLLWTITFSYVPQPLTLRELGEIESGSSFDVYVETGYGENRLVVYNADIVGKTYVSADYQNSMGFYGNGYGWFADDAMGTNKHMMQYYFFDDEFGGYVYIDADGYPVEKWFLIGDDYGYLIQFSYLDAKAWSDVFGKYYNVDDFNEYITLNEEASMLGVVSCPWRKSGNNIYIYVPDSAGFYTKHTVTYNASKGTLTYDGHEYSKTFSKEVTLTNAQNWTITFNVVDLEKNTAGYTVASATLTTKDGKSIELYFGYYTVGSVQYGNLKYYWYVGFYVDIEGGAGQSFLRFEVTTDLDPETFDGSTFEFAAKNEDDAYVLFTSESGDILIWDERSDGDTATFNGVIVIKADGTVLIGTWEIGPTFEYFVFTEEGGDETFNFLADEDEGTLEFVEA